MKLLLPLDYRPNNRAALGLLDPHTGTWDGFLPMDLDEPFKRLGFRGAAWVGERLFVVNSAAIYELKLSLDDPRGLRAKVVRKLCRPEWALGERAAADLHHVHYSEARDRLFVASSFMDAIDELSLDLKLIRRHYLWDLCPSVAKEAPKRLPDAMDLVHVNHIAEHQGNIYLTLGNWNTTRKGCVVCFDTGEVVLDDLAFPHDGVFHDGRYYLSETGTQRVTVFSCLNGKPRGDPVATLDARIQQPAWVGSFQWVRGIALSERHLFFGATQWRKSVATQPQIPARLVAYDRETLEYRGELFLPPMGELQEPSIFTLLAVDDGRGEDFDYDAWRARAPSSSEPQAQSHIVPVPAQEYPLGFVERGLLKPRLAKEWHRVASRACRIEPRSDGMLVVTSTMSTKQKAFLRMGVVGLDQPPERPAVWRVAERTRYELSLWLPELSGTLSIDVWIAEYDADKRLRTVKLGLSRGPRHYRFRTGRGTQSFRLRLRFSGAGNAVLSAPTLRPEARGPS